MGKVMKRSSGCLNADERGRGDGFSTSGTTVEQRTKTKKRGPGERGSSPM